MIYNKYYTVDAVVKSAMADIGESTTHLYQLFLMYALEELREMNISFSREIKTVVLPMNSYKSIDIPSDCIDWVKIAIQVGERLMTMGVQTDLALHNDVDDCGNPIINLPQRPFDEKINGVNFDSYGGYWLNNFTPTNSVGANPVDSGRVFAYGGALPSRGLYRIDRERGQIRFDDSVMNANIYLEYISDGFNPSETTYINPLCYAYLRKAIHFRRVDNDENVSANEKERKSRDLYYAKLEAAGRLNDLVIQDIINSSRAGYRLTNKI